MLGLGTEALRTLALTVVALGQTLFVILYLTFPWYRTFLGKALFFKAAILATLVDLGLVARTFPDLLDWSEVFIGLYFLLGFGVWFQLLAFLRVRIDAKRKDKRPFVEGRHDEYDGYQPSEGGAR